MYDLSNVQETHFFKSIGLRILPLTADNTLMQSKIHNPFPRRGGKIFHHTHLEKFKCHDLKAANALLHFKPG